MGPKKLRVKTNDESEKKGNQNNQEGEVSRKITSIYNSCMIEKKVVLNVNQIGENIVNLILNKLKGTYEGKCIDEGYIKKESIKLIRYSSGLVKNNNVIFDVVFECDSCTPIEGMIINCNVKNITKAGIRAEVDSEGQSPIVIFIARDHHYNNKQFNELKEGEKIEVRVIGQRFELNDTFVSVIGELVSKKKPRLNIKN